MAEIVPDEGLDFLLSMAFRGTAVPANYYVGLFVGGSATTVPANTATRATMGGTFAEVGAGWGYAAQPIAPGTGNWSAPATPGAAIWGQSASATSGIRATNGIQVSFPAATAAYGTPIHGFFIATAVTGGVVLMYSNWSDSTAIPNLAIGDVVKVTPTFGLGG